MKNLLPVLALLMSSAIVVATPNVILINADDLGYGDLGYVGSDIATPRIDVLATQSNPDQADRAADVGVQHACATIARAANELLDLVQGSRGAVGRPRMPKLDVQLVQVVRIESDHVLIRPKAWTNPISPRPSTNAVRFDVLEDIPL